MTYQELDNLLGLNDLNDFANQLTIKGCQVTAYVQPDGTLLLSDDDKWKYWGLNFDWTNPWGLTDKINTIVRNIRFAIFFTLSGKLLGPAGKVGGTKSGRR